VSIGIEREKLREDLPTACMTLAPLIVNAYDETVPILWRGRHRSLVFIHFAHGFRITLDLGFVFRLPAVE
jgi:hypothetical protein